MPLFVYLAGAVVLFLAASFAAVLSYGHFARRSRGEDSFALETRQDQTELDRGVEPRLADHDGMSGLSMVSGNLDAFALRALATRAAGRSLDLMYYYWKDDLTGRLLASEVLAAADRGVRVRLLIDDINTAGRDRLYLAFDEHPNIAVRLFNPSRARSGGIRRGMEMVLRAFTVNRRMHHKAWIADGRLAVVGGRNIGDEYFGAGDQSNFRDIDMLLMGPVVQATEEVFDSYWNSEVSMPIRALVRLRKGGLARLRRELAAAAAAGTARPYVERVLQRISLPKMLDNAATYWTRDARIVSDPPEKALGLGTKNWIMSTLMPVLAAADRSVEIVSPYFVPGVDGTNGLTRMSAAGVDVAVLTNSLAATDVAVVHGGYAPYRKALLEGGVRLYELQPFLGRAEMSIFGSRGASLHTKAFTVDNHTGFVGSFNFDPRSISLNTEMGVLFVEPDLVGEMHELFRDETDAQTSYRVFLAGDGSLRWKGETEGRMVEHKREPEAGLWRRVVAAVVTWLPIESQL